MKLVTYVLFMFLIVSCSENAKTGQIAESFLEKYYSHNFDDAKKYSSKKTIASIDTMLMYGKIEPLSKDDMPIVKIEDILIIQDTAYCRYMLMVDDNDGSAMTENLILIKEEGEWKADF